MVNEGVRRLVLLAAGYSLVTLFLVALRAAEAISWGWYWVLCPLWLPFALVGIAFASFLMVRAMAQSRP